MKAIAKRALQDLLLFALGILLAWLILSYREHDAMSERLSSLEAYVARAVECPGPRCRWL